MQGSEVNEQGGRGNAPKPYTTLHGVPVQGMQGFKAYPACARAGGVQTSEACTTLHPYTRAEAPEVPACPREDGAGFKVWCRWCDCWHLHGATYGHRSAHCHNPDSPYRATGYVLVPPAGVTA